MNAEELLRKFDAERDAYLATLQQLHEALTRNVIASNASTPTSSAPAQSAPTRPVFDRVARLSMGDSDRRTAAPLSSLYKSSIISGEEEELSDDDEALYVQDFLPPVALKDEDLRSHLKKHGWDDSARKILEPILTSEGRLKIPSLFPTGNRPADDRPHISMYQVFAVGADGAPLALHPASSTSSQAMWNIIRVIPGPFSYTGDKADVGLLGCKYRCQKATGSWSNHVRTGCVSSYLGIVLTLR